MTAKTPDVMTTDVAAGTIWPQKGGALLTIQRLLASEAIMRAADAAMAFQQTTAHLKPVSLFTSVEIFIAKSASDLSQWLTDGLYHTLIDEAHDSSSYSPMSWYSAG